VEFEVGQHVWLNIWDFKMLDGMAAHFTTTYVEFYEILHKLHFNVYILKFPNNFVALPTFHVLTLKLIMVRTKTRLEAKGATRSG
jgi:hypothetical protein